MNTLLCFLGIHDYFELTMIDHIWKICWRCGKEVKSSLPFEEKVRQKIYTHMIGEVKDEEN